MSMRSQRIAIDRVEIALEGGPAAHAALLAAQLEGALAARLGDARAERVAGAIAARLLDALGEQAAWL